MARGMGESNRVQACWLALRLHFLQPPPTGGGCSRWGPRQAVLWLGRADPQGWAEKDLVKKNICLEIFRTGQGSEHLDLALKSPLPWVRTWRGPLDMSSPAEVDL